MNKNLTIADLKQFKKLQDRAIKKLIKSGSQASQAETTEDYVCEVYDSIVLSKDNVSTPDYNKLFFFIKAADAQQLMQLLNSGQVNNQTINVKYIFTSNDDGNWHSSIDGKTSYSIILPLNFTDMYAEFNIGQTYYYVEVEDPDTNTVYIDEDGEYYLAIYYKYVESTTRPILYYENSFAEPDGAHINLTPDNIELAIDTTGSAPALGTVTIDVANYGDFRSKTEFDYDWNVNGNILIVKIYNVNGDFTGFDIEGSFTNHYNGPSYIELYFDGNDFQGSVDVTVYPYHTEWNSVTTDVAGISDIYHVSSFGRDYNLNPELEFSFYHPEDVTFKYEINGQTLLRDYYTEDKSTDRCVVKFSSMFYDNYAGSFRADELIIHNAQALE